MILKEQPPQQVNASIWTPEDVYRDFSVGVVVSKGRDEKNEIPELMEGIKVLFSSRTIEKNGTRFNRNEFEYEGETYVLVPFDDLLAIYDRIEATETGAGA